MNAYVVLLKRLLRSTSFWVTGALLSLFLLAPSLFSFDVFSLKSPRMVELSQVNLDLAKANASDNDPTKPEDLKDLDAQRYAALLRSQSAVSVTAYANELSHADEALKSAADLGYGSWTLEDEAMLVYEKSAANLDVANSPKASGELSGLQYISYSLALLPSFIWPLASLLITNGAHDLLARGSLMRRLPLSTASRAASLSLACVTFPLILFLMVLMPSFLVACLRNGIGNPSDAIVFIAGGTVQSTTTLTSSAMWVGSLWLSSSSLCLASVLIHLVTDNSKAGIGGAVTLGVISSSPIAALAISQCPLLKWTPIGYTDPARFAGYYGCWPTTSMTPLNLVQGFGAVLVPLVWLGLIYALTMLVSVRSDCHA